VGYDINCGVRLLRTGLTEDEVRPRIKELILALFASVPSGVGSEGRVKLSPRDMDAVARRGAGWAVQEGYGLPEDILYIEEHGAFPGADPDQVSVRAKERGKCQLGTLGSGNHFLEVQTVAEIFDPEAARAYGLHLGEVTVLIHTGSRGFGYQICSDHLQVTAHALKKYGIQVPDKQLACAPLSSPEARAYLACMACGVNFAFANRQLITHWVRETFGTVFGKGKGAKIALVYDVAHNSAKVEEHLFGDERRQVCVHRKGATRAFGPGDPRIPEAYRGVGQPVFIPGDMGRASYVLAGTDRAMRETWGSTCHGAGRAMSRSAATRLSQGQGGRALERELLEKYGVFVRAGDDGTLAEEAPLAYKDVSEVVEVVHGAGISKKVAKLKPLGTIKG